MRAKIWKYGKWWWWECTDSAGGVIYYGGRDTWAEALAAALDDLKVYYESRKVINGKSS